jgi:hypothetical protein
VKFFDRPGALGYEIERLVQLGQVGNLDYYVEITERRGTETEFAAADSKTID